MTREEIIKLAREAELIYWRPNSTFSDGVWWMDAGEPGDELERFAALVAAVERDRMCEQFNIPKELAHEKAKSNETD